MHYTADQSGRMFFDCYANSTHKRVLDIGAMDVNGSLRRPIRTPRVLLSPGPSATDIRFVWSRAERCARKWDGGTISSLCFRRDRHTAHRARSSSTRSLTQQMFGTATVWNSQIPRFSPKMSSCSRKRRPQPATPKTAPASSMQAWRQPRLNWQPPSRTARRSRCSWPAFVQQ
jgi:hypothetical protein